MQPFRRGVSMMGAATAIDLATKWTIVTQVMDPPRTIPITPFFNLVLVFNRGVSFGLLSSDNHFAPYLLMAIALVIVAFLLAWLRRAGSRTEGVALGAIIGGAIANIVDRWPDGAVTDFLDFHLGGYHWRRSISRTSPSAAALCCWFSHRFGPGRAAPLAAEGGRRPHGETLPPRGRSETVADERVALGAGPARRHMGGALGGWGSCRWRWSGRPVGDFRLFWVSLLFVTLMPTLYAAFIWWGGREPGFRRWQVLALDGAYVAFVAVVVFWVPGVA